MTHEHQPEISKISDCKAYKESLKLNYTVLKMQNDERQKAITEDMLERSRLEILELADNLEYDLVEDILDMIETLLAHEYNRRGNINQAIEFFGLEVNGYNELFINYIDNFALYNQEDDWAYSIDDVIDIIYSPSDQENHFHPGRQADLNMGCVACTSLILQDAFVYRI